MKIAYLPAVLSAVALTATTLHAGLVTWNAPANIAGDSDVSTNGTLIEAYNFAGEATTVNGVTFQPFNMGAMSNPAGTSTYSVTSSIVNNSNTGSAFAPFSTLLPAYKTLLGTAAGRGDSTMTLTMSGLSIGGNYEFQTWMNDPRDFSGTIFSMTVTSGDAVTLDPGAGTEGSLGQYVIGTFVADAPTQTVEFFGSEIGVVNGYQLRQIIAPVPEPGTILFGMALVGAAGCARRRPAGEAGF